MRKWYILIIVRNKQGYFIMTRTDRKTIKIEQAENLAIAYQSYNEAKQRGLKGEIGIWRKMLWNAQYQTRIYLEPMSALETDKGIF